MDIKKKIQNLCETHNVKFISFKYLDEDEFLKQVDVLYDKSQNLECFLEEYGDFVFTDHIFIDPFRSHSTISVFCIKNNSVIQDLREQIESFDNSSTYNSFSAEMKFWIFDNELDYHQPALKQSDPFDLYANLRSDIIITLNEIGVKTGLHYHGTTKGENVISVKESGALQLLDTILVARFIVNNCVASYGMKNNFNSNKSSNITLNYECQKKKIQIKKNLLGTGEKNIYNEIKNLF